MLFKVFMGTTLSLSDTTFLCISLEFAPSRVGLVVSVSASKGCKYAMQQTAAML